LQRKLHNKDSKDPRKNKTLPFFQSTVLPVELGIRIGDSGLEKGRKLLKREKMFFSHLLLSPSHQSLKITN
jgi:hypothetical protein